MGRCPARGIAKGRARAYGDALAAPEKKEEKNLPPGALPGPRARAPSIMQGNHARCHQAAPLLSSKACTFHPIQAVTATRKAHLELRTTAPDTSAKANMVSGITPGGGGGGEEGGEGDGEGRGRGGKDVGRESPLSFIRPFSNSIEF